MKEIYLILLGIFVGRYIINIFDLISQHFNNIYSLKATEIQCKIDELGANKIDDGNRIGFQMASEEEYYDDEE